MSIYHKKRNELIEELGGECDIEGCENEDLEFHHVNPADGHGQGVGGWNHIYLVKRDLKEGVEVVLLCRKHHLEEHQ